MRNKQNAFALFCKIAHNFHKLVYFLRSKNSGRLVKNKNAVVSVEHFQNFGALLHTDGNIFNNGVRVNLKIVLFRKGNNFFAGFFFLQETGFSFFHAKNNIV